MAVPLQAIETNHQDFIHDAELDFFGEKLATCSSDQTIKVYKVDPSGQNQHIADLTGHDGPIWELAWAHPQASNGSMIASCSLDSKVIIYKEFDEAWESVFVYDGHEASVNSICWAPYQYGLVLLAGSSDGFVSVISFKDKNTWETQKIKVCSSGVNSVSWAPIHHVGMDSSTKEEVRFVAGCADKTVQIFKKDAESGEWKLEQKLNKHVDWVRDVAWAPSSFLPANTIASCSEDGLVCIWTQEHEGSAWECVEINNFGCSVWRLSWSPTGRVLAVSAGDHSVTLWKESLDGKWSQLKCLSTEG